MKMILKVVSQIPGIKKCLNTEMYGSLEGTQLLTKLHSNTKQELGYYKEVIQFRQKTVYFNY